MHLYLQTLISSLCTSINLKSVTKTVFYIKLFIKPNNNSSKKLCVFSLLYYLFETGSVKCIDLDHLPFLKHLKLKYLYIAYQCNGLVSLTYWVYPPQVYLWNPSINGEFNFKALPLTPSPPTPQGFTSRGLCTIGFGFDPKTNDYKVVRIWTFFERYGVVCVQTELRYAHLVIIPGERLMPSHWFQLNQGWVVADVALFT